MYTPSSKSHGIHLRALAFVFVSAAIGCGADVASDVAQAGDELKGGTPAGGQDQQQKDHGKAAAQAGAGASETHGQGDVHSQAGHGSTAHGALAGHGNAAEHAGQAGHGHSAEHGGAGDDQDAETDETM